MLTWVQEQGILSKLQHGSLVDGACGILMRGVLVALDVEDFNDPPL